MLYFLFSIVLFLSKFTRPYQPTRQQCMQVCLLMHVFCVLCSVVTVGPATPNEDLAATTTTKQQTSVIIRRRRRRCLLRGFTVNDNERTTNDKRRTTNEERRTTNEERRTTNDGRRTNGELEALGRRRLHRRRRRRRRRSLLQRRSSVSVSTSSLAVGCWRPFSSFIQSSQFAVSTEKRFAWIM